MALVPLALLSTGVGSPARAHSVWVTSVVRDCATALDDTVLVDVMLENTISPVDDGTIWITFSFSASRLTFVSGARGDLISDWTQFGATSPSFSSVEIEMSNATALPPGTSGQLARLKFVTDCCPNGFYTMAVELSPSGSGDFASPMGMVSGLFMCARTQSGTILVASGFTACDGGVDTARVDVRLVDTSGPVDAGGLDVLVSGYYGGVLSYLGFQRGELTAAWETFDVIEWIVGDTSRFRCVGSSSSAIPAGTTGTFVTLLYRVNCCAQGPWNYSPIEPELPTADLATYQLQVGAWACVPVGTRPTTWGYVKSLYR